MGFDDSGRFHWLTSISARYCHSRSASTGDRQNVSLVKLPSFAIMSANPSTDSAIARLKEIRPELLLLHKALLDSERIVYEQTHGRIANSGEFFRLVISDDAFSWLRPISQFIVQIDELLDLRKKDKIEPESAAILLEKARLMIRPNENSLTPLGENYFQAIQRDPKIALMHADIAEKLRKQNSLEE